MQLLVIVVNQEEHLDSVLAALLEVGITGGTVIDTVGMGRIIAHGIPLFAGLRHLFDSDRPQNKTIFSVIDDSVDVEEVVALFEDVCGSLDEPGTGILFTVPIAHVYGLAEEL